MQRTKRKEILYRKFVADCKANPVVCLHGTEIGSMDLLNSKTLELNNSRLCLLFEFFLIPHGCVLFTWPGDWARRLQGFPYSYSLVNMVIHRFEVRVSRYGIIPEKSMGYEAFLSSLLSIRYKSATGCSSFAIEQHFQDFQIGIFFDPTI